MIWKLKQSLIYLIGMILSPPLLLPPTFPPHTNPTNHPLPTGYFLLGDALNTTVTVIGTLQNSLVAYDTLTLTYVLLVGIAAQALGIFLFWRLQRLYALSTKTMFVAVMLGILLLDGWGMLGIWTPNFGFHNVWEVWLYQVFYGLFVCPWYSYSQIMISEVTPRGKEFLFFSLFGVVGKTSAFLGPAVSAAIIDRATAAGMERAVSAPFYFLFGLSAVSAVGWGVDLGRSRREQEGFLEGERKEREMRGVDGVGV